MNLAQELSLWSGRSVEELNEIFTRHAKYPSFSEHLLELMADDRLQRATTWLLKRFFEEKLQLTTEQTVRAFALLPGLKDWESKLHLLQCLPYMVITREQADDVNDFLYKCMADSNKFVRAWTYNGFYELGRQHDDFRMASLQILRAALRDESAPAVRARVRSVLKKLE